jgi:hypothetical protein
MGIVKNPKIALARYQICFVLALFFCVTITMSSFAASLNGAGTLQIISSDKFEEGTVAPPQPAAGDKVMLYCGNNGNCGEGLTNLTNFYVGMGVTVDQLNSFPADLSVYRLIFIIMPNTDFSTDQINQLGAFVYGSGRLVLLSDWSPFYTGHAVLNALLKNLGVPIQVDVNAVDSGCENFTSDIEMDQITEGVASLEYGYTDTVTVAAPAKILIRTKSTAQPMVAVGQPPGAPMRPGADIVVAGDSNSFTDLCAPLANEIFWKNLYQFSTMTSIKGKVTDRNTGNPIDQAAVIALQIPAWTKTKTNSDGMYQISGLSPGTWKVLCWKIGYKFVLKTVTLDPGETETVDFRLMPKATSSVNDIPSEFREAINAAPAISPSRHKLTTTWGAIKRR